MYTREEVMTYIDKYGRYHHKPTDGINPSSGNGWIYTAYAVKLGLPVNKYKLNECFKLCSQNGILIRNPNMETSPISRDEILGLAKLGLLKPKVIKGFNFSPYPIPRFNPFKLAVQLWDLRPSLKRHRNYFWENNLDQLYRFAFSVPLVDRDFILNNTEMETDIISHAVYWAIAKIDSMFGKDSGIRWLKYGKSLEAMQEEFPEDHPFRLTN